MINHFYRKVPLPVKLMLIGIIPIAFIIYLSGSLYYEKAQQVKLIGDYIERIHESETISSLMDAMQTERRYSYEYALTKKMYDSVLSQRKQTDSVLALLKQSNDLALADFPEYTFIKDLEKTRLQLDTSKNFSANSIMQFYTTAIFRLNTLNSTAPASNTYLKPVYQDLIAQKILFEMITFIGIIRTNIYNVLYTRQYMVETLMGTIGTHDVYNTYEIEFRLKASPATVKEYDSLKSNTALKQTTAYIDTLFKTFKFDSSFTASSWWTTSTKGINQMRGLHRKLWTSVEMEINDIYQDQKKERNLTLIFLLIALVIVVSFILYTVRVIDNTLRDLRIAARKISLGSTDVRLDNMPKDVIGKVSNSILQINENSKNLAFAADAIGKGNFAVDVSPRSSEDLLGNSIMQMKYNLQEYAKQKDRIQNETLDLVNKKDDFMSIASHELKTPVTSLKAYTQILKLQLAASSDKPKEALLEKMDSQINKLTVLINDLLDSSKLREGDLAYNRHPVQFNRILAEIIDEVQRANPGHQIILGQNEPATVLGDKQRISQVISNFLTNAIKYGQDKDIRVSSSIQDNKIICSVADEGIGIPAGEKEKIFERFYRISGENLHTYPGLGLGLYISKEIVHHHNGEIWVESGEGKGTVFYFSLPLLAKASGKENKTLSHDYGTVEGIYMNAGKNSPLVIIINGHNGFYNYGMFPYLQDKLFENGISTFSFNFSHGGINGGGDYFEDLEKYERNCMRLEREDLLTVLRKLPAEFPGHNRIFLFSHSMGSVPAIMGAARALNENINIDGLILAAPVSTLNFWPAEMLAEWASAGVYYKKNNRTKQDLPQGFELLQEILRADAEWNIQKEIGKLNKPVLIIHGEMDEAVPVSHAENLFSQIGSVAGNVLHIIPGATHTFNTRHPFEGSTPELEELIKVVVSWINNR